MGQLSLCLWVLINNPPDSSGVSGATFRARTGQNTDNWKINLNLHSRHWEKKHYLHNKLRQIPMTRPLSATPPKLNLCFCFSQLFLCVFVVIIVILNVVGNLITCKESRLSPRIILILQPPRAVIEATALYDNPKNVKVAGTFNVLQLNCK